MDLEAASLDTCSCRCVLNASMLFWMRRLIWPLTPCAGTNDSVSPNRIQGSHRPLRRRALARRRMSRSADLAAQQGKNRLRGLVGLREHARAGLLKDVLLRVVRHLGRHVHVAD